MIWASYWFCCAQVLNCFLSSVSLVLCQFYFLITSPAVRTEERKSGKFFSAAPKYAETSPSNVRVLGGGAVGRSLGHEEEAVTNGITRGIPGELLCLFCSVRTHWEDSHLWTRKTALTRHRICLLLDLGLPTSRNTFLLLISHPVYGILWSSPNEVGVI